METDGVRHIVPLTTEPSPTIGLTDPSWDWTEKTTPLQTQRSEVRGGEVKEFFLPNSDLEDTQEPKQVFSNYNKSRLDFHSVFITFSIHVSS